MGNAALQRMSSIKSKQKYSVAELFCGCGGFSHGFWKTGRFKTVFGNDIKKYALKTFESNHVHEGLKPATILGDIRVVPDHKIQGLLSEGGVSSLDCLIGGPPCQGFSQMRRTEGRKESEIVKYGGYNKLDQDPRNDLVLRFLEIAAALNPKVIVIENVPQFLSHYHDGKKGGIAQQVESILNEMGYHVICDILNAADYGVPQLRQRAVIVASRLGSITLPMPTHGDPDLLNGWSGTPWCTVNDAICDLPNTAPLAGVTAAAKPDYTRKADSTYLKLMRTSKTFPESHVTRAYQRQVIKIIQEMRQGETWDEACRRQQKRYEKLIANAVLNGESEADARKRLEIEGRIQPVFYKKYYWSAYTRLAWDRPALTITANANFLGSGRFTHPEVNRGITMREAARLQSFDDAFSFITSEVGQNDPRSLGVGFDMIGEAVPPLLARAIGSTVAVHLDEHT